MKSIVISGAARSGTTVVARALGSSRNTINLGEIFQSLSSNNDGLNSVIAGRTIDAFSLPAFVRAFVEEEARSRQATCAIFDCKFEYFRVLPGTVVDGISVPTVLTMEDGPHPVVVMRRLNLLARHVSHRRAESSGVWSAARTDDLHKTAVVIPVEAIGTEIDDMLIDFEVHLSAVERACPVSVLDFEALLSDGFWQGPFVELARGLVGDHALRSYAPDRIREAPRPLLDYVENAHELVEALDAVGLRWMIEPLSAEEARSEYLARRAEVFARRGQALLAERAMLDGILRRPKETAALLNSLIMQRDDLRNELKVTAGSLNAAMNDIEALFRERALIDFALDNLRQERDMIAADRDRAVCASRDMTAARDELAASRRATLRELEAARADRAARRSQLAEEVDYLDYRIHHVLSRLPFASGEFKARFGRAARKMLRERYVRPVRTD